MIPFFSTFCGSVGRAEALAAVALVVGAKREPVAALRRLAMEDPALQRLAWVADLCASGTALPDALVAVRLVSRSDAARLGGLTPELLADELTRLAQRTASPPLGETLANWLPLWAVLVATVPSLIIGAAVAGSAGTLYGGLWQALGISKPTVNPAYWWFTQVAAVACTALIVAGFWRLLRRSPTFSQCLVMIRRLEQTSLFAGLVRSLRNGSDHGRMLDQWRRRSGDPHAVQQALLQSGGDPTAAFLTLGLIPRQVDGRPDWDTALAEADDHRRRVADDVAPWLIALLVIVGIVGFMTWGVTLYAPIYPILQLQSSLSGPLIGSQGFATAIHGVLAIVLPLFKIAAGAVILASVMVPARQSYAWLVGSVRDWPLVADRLARALERREAIDAVLRGLRFAVERPMRRRIDRALRDDDPMPGRRLARAGIVPCSQAALFSAADAADLPALLRSSAETPDDHGLQVIANDSKPTLIVVVVVAGIASYLAASVFPKFKTMFLSLCQDGFGNGNQLIDWALIVVQFIILGFAVATIITAVGQRFGWWTALSGWARLARGLVLRRLLATGSSEQELANAVRKLAPRASTSLDDAARRGDLPGVLAASGWPVRNAVELDRAITAHLVTADRRRARLALTARLMLPFVMAVPVGLIAAGTMLLMVGIQRGTLDMARNAQNGGGGGTPSMALIYWWTTRCEAQGQAVVDAIHEAELDAFRARHPQPSAKPPTVMPARGTK